MLTHSAKRESRTLRACIRRSCYVLYLTEVCRRHGHVRALGCKRRCRSTSARCSSSLPASRRCSDCSCCSPGCRIAFTALAWWGVAYLVGGFSGVIWRLGDAVSPPLPAVHPRCSAVHCRRHDLERGAGVSWPAGAMGRDVLRRGRVARCVLVSRIHRVGGVTPGPEFDDRCQLYIPDRHRAVARAAQIADPTLAGDLRADAARRWCSCFRWRLRRCRKAAACSVSVPAGSRSSRSKSCCMSSARRLSCLCWRRTAPSATTRWRRQPIH